jgi:hypothetical protein
VVLVLLTLLKTASSGCSPGVDSDVYYDEDSQTFEGANGGNLLPSLTISDGWTTDGVWGTDLDRVEGAGNTYSGASAVKITTTSALEMWTIDPIFVEPLMSYNLYAIVKTTRNNVGDDVTLTVDQLDVNGALVASTVVRTGPSRVTGSFDYLGGILLGVFGNTRFIVPKISKAAAAFEVIVDRVVLERLPPSHIILAPAASLTANGIAQTFVFNNSSDASSGMLSSSPANGRIDFHCPGTYYVEVFAKAIDFNAGDDFGIKITGSFVNYDHGIIFNRSEDVVTLDSDSITRHVSNVVTYTGGGAGSPPGPGSISLTYIANSAGTPTFFTSASYMRVTRLSFW